MKILGKYYKDFILRGLVAMGFGAIALSAIYAILGLCGVVEALPVYSVSLGYITVTLLAFLCGGMTVVYKIEELAISAAITLHGIVLYIAYAIMYLVNGWLKDGIIPFLIFTAVFIIGFVLVWIIIYFITIRNTKLINNRLKNRAE